MLLKQRQAPAEKEAEPVLFKSNINQACEGVVAFTVALLSRRQKTKTVAM